MAACGNYALAQYRLALCYSQGRGVEKPNEKIAFKWCQKAAEQGYAKAQYNLGKYYLQGKIVVKDRSKACTWFEAAAAQGHQIARQALQQMERGSMVQFSGSPVHSSVLLKTPASIEGGKLGF